MSKRRTFRLSIALALVFAVLWPQAALAGRGSFESASVAGEVVKTAPNVNEEVSAEDADSEGADSADGAGADGDAGQPKRKGNSFARALAAPFRALARLFGGGRKSGSQQSKKQPTTPARDANAAAQTQTATTSNNAPSNTTPPANAEAAAQTPAQTQQPSAQTQTTVAAVTVKPVETPAAPVPANDEAAGAVKTEPVFVPRTSAPAEAGAGARIVRPAAGEVVEQAKPKMWVPLIVGVPADPVSQGRALLQQGYVQEAIAELQTAATTVGPQLAEANNLLGLAYDRLGWHQQAAEAYRRALVVAPKDFAVLANLGYSLYLADDYRGALRRLNAAAKLAPAEPVILNNLGVVHARLGHYDDAYKSFARASNEYDAHVKLAGILEDQRKDREAAKHYEAALRLQPGASAVLERLVAVYERTGQRDKADTARRALGQPKNPQKTTTGGGGG
ncbi:MAG TPA: tetratricopeptide repeat protein [Pyrinomonadaceae bacterium]|nr:tetratricopeptide repeat protein [Pyrinomonadaceae bacterium]